MAPMDPNPHGDFFTKIMGTVAFFNGSVAFFAYRVNGPLVLYKLSSMIC